MAARAAPITATDAVDIPVKGRVEAVVEAVVLLTWGLLGRVTTIPPTSAPSVVDVVP